MKRILILLMIMLPYMGAAQAVDTDDYTAVRYTEMALDYWNNEYEQFQDNPYKPSEGIIWWYNDKIVIEHGTVTVTMDFLRDAPWTSDEVLAYICSDRGDERIVTVSNDNNTMFVSVINPRQWRYTYSITRGQVIDETTDGS